MSVRLIESPPTRQLVIGEGMGEIAVTVKLTNALDEERAAEGEISREQVRSLDVQAIVDTGAVRSVIPQFVLNKLGSRIRGQEVAEYADGRQESVGRTAPILFEIMGRETSDEALVLGDEVLIGQTILEKLDLLADCRNRRLIPNPDHPNQPVTRIV